jgi:hypothetical protein
MGFDVGCSTISKNLTGMIRSFERVCLVHGITQGRAEAMKWKMVKTES